MKKKNFNSAHVTVKVSLRATQQFEDETKKGQNTMEQSTDSTQWQ